MCVLCCALLRRDVMCACCVCVCVGGYTNAMNRRDPMYGRSQIGQMTDLKDFSMISTGLRGTLIDDLTNMKDLCASPEGLGGARPCACRGGCAC